MNSPPEIADLGIPQAKSLRTLLRVVAVLSVIGLLVVGPAALARDEDDLDLFFDMDLEQLLNIDVSVASYESKPVREQPGIVTLITRAEISRSGARDLIDIMNLVPGFRTVSEVHETVVLGARGIYAAEGKILLLIDGIEMNENLFGYILLGHHYDASMIEQVEIIRGPGSAMYGGSAEIAVIKITTRGGTDSTTYANSTLSFNRGRLNHRESGVHSVQHYEWGYSILGSILRGTRSNEKHETVTTGNVYDMSKNSDIRQEFFDLGLRMGNLSIRAIWDRYNYDYMDRYGSFYGRRTANFDTLVFQAQYDLALFEDKLSITPKIGYRKHDAWQYETVNGTEKEITGERWTFGLQSIIETSESSLLTLGIEHYTDKGTAHPSEAKKGGTTPGYDYATYFRNGTSDHASYSNWALYSQFDIPAWKLGDLSVGGRYEHHDVAGDNFVPRVALTKVFDKFHYKFLIAQAFRTPNIENIRYAERINVTLKIEKTTTYEIELGYKFTDNLFATINVFDVEVDSPLFYSASTASYENADGAVASVGFEAGLRYVDSWGDVKIGYAYYASTSSAVDLWATDDSTQASAFPNHQVSYDVTVNLPWQSTINVNGYITDGYKAYGVAPLDGMGAVVYNSIQKYDPTFILNLYYQIAYKSFEFGLGISDLAGENEAIASYDSFQSPVQQMGREVFLRFAYTF